MTTLLNQLKRHSTVVVDTGDTHAISRYAAQDVTTNPTLILQAVSSGRYDRLLDELIASVSDVPTATAVEQLSERLVVALGCILLQHVPGSVSSEIDARLSFDRPASVAKARRLVALYQAAGIPRSRVLIKLAATWEGICAARELEREGIRCNLTLVFGIAQARACAEAGAYLISPFVGRALDWHLQANPGISYAPAMEPGVQQVAAIHAYLRRHGHATLVMAASFRNIGEIVALAGCDRLTISPPLMEELASIPGVLEPALVAVPCQEAPPPALSEADFRWQLNEDAMASEKLAEGIRGFARDQCQLEWTIRHRLAR
ncbi:transaldolase [Pseudomonas sp. NPDC089996]|uniref:transaldolase n=1 Tax=Pseudomonas sp. NPDC089996 TaxID=3364474 RepID=UPI0037FE5CF4